MDQLKIIIADDQTLLRDGLKTILDLEQDMNVVATTVNGEDAIEAIKKENPHVVLLDIKMPIMDGIECLKQIKQFDPSIIVLMLTTFIEEHYIVESLTLGADGFLLKDMPGDKLITSIRDAASGQLMMPSIIATKLADMVVQLSATNTTFDSKQWAIKDRVGLSEREGEIVHLLVKGFNNRQIASTLHMSEGTIKNYISIIYSKIGINDRAKAIVYFTERWKDSAPTTSSQ
ncbi:response regulator transcription factor [Aureibacillus halotolerans]|uniref:LuxR family two component transcriptional regulator n=1 Tax=Aureibacillus halotolerans TaxID=1508390 RepID=A0A4R6UCM2_9BACI|nr:response regulator transcription factor [Aureibacillus halotolerans]TDQ40834.1 LuxR family two component transcriptional regulator [Aureibacillus halotolerans]